MDKRELGSKTAKGGFANETYMSGKKWDTKEHENYMQRLKHQIIREESAGWRTLCSLCLSTLRSCTATEDGCGEVFSDEKAICKKFNVWKQEN